VAPGTDAIVKDDGILPAILDTVIHQNERYDREQHEGVTLSCKSKTKYVDVIAGQGKTSKRSRVPDIFEPLGYRELTDAPRCIVAKAHKGNIFD